MKSIIVLGGGGHAKVLISAIESMGLYSIDGIVDPQLSLGYELMGYRVIGNDDVLTAAHQKKWQLALGVGSIRAEEKRKHIFEKFASLGYRFPSIVHKTATVHSKTILGAGVQIMAGGIIQPGATIGENTIVNTGAIVEHDSKIGNHCHIAPGAVLGGEVTVGDGSFIGLGARILPGVKIGTGVTIGAGAVVIRNVGDSKTVVGIPAREIEMARS